MGLLVDCLRVFIWFIILSLGIDIIFWVLEYWEVILECVVIILVILAVIGFIVGEEDKKNNGSKRNNTDDETKKEKRKKDKDDYTDNRAKNVATSCLSAICHFLIPPDSPNSKPDYRKTYYSGKGKNCLKTMRYYYDNGVTQRYEEYSEPFYYYYNYEQDGETYQNYIYLNEIEYHVDFNRLGQKHGEECRYYVEEMEDRSHPCAHKIYECHWKDGNKDGKEIKYDRKGNVISVTHWKNGVEV